MSFSATGGGPEADEGLEIPGFPKPHRPEGFAGNLQGHLEKLASNAKSIHHVLEALCGGLDRLEKKMDTNSSQVEARLANIVHHMSGEADEDTMSAWSSLNGGGGSGGGGGGGLGSPGEIGPALSLRRRTSFGVQMQMTSMGSFSENPPQDDHLLSDQVTLESELAEVGRGGSVGSDTSRIGDTFGDVAQRAKEAAEAGEGEEGRREGGEGAGAAPTRGGASIPIGAAAETVASSAARSGSLQMDGTAHRGDKSGDGVEPSSPSSSPPQPTQMQAEEQRPLPAAVEKTAASTTDGRALAEGRRRKRSNQDDQSNDNGNDNDNDSDTAGGGDSSITGGGSTRGEETSPTPRGGRECPPPLHAQGSVETGGSDARYIARQRWIWAFGRVCQLVRRRKRKQFEIMSQRATDRAVRMGSRVSVIEKRLDETKEHLMLVRRLGDKSGAHTAQIHNLSETVAELCKLSGLEERFHATVRATQAKMETALKSGLNELEGRLARGHRELETTLEAEIRRNGAKLEDMDDRYARSEEALRRAEERIGEVQEEVSAVTHSISDVERQLRVDEDRLDSLENLKKAHQRRLSELRVQLEGSAPAQAAAAAEGIVPTEPMEAEETDDERMARFLKAAGAATEFLATDLAKILETNRRSVVGASGGASGRAPDSAAEKNASETAHVQRNQVTGGGGSAEEGEEDIFDKLRHVSVEAAGFSRLCGMSMSASTSSTAGDGKNGGGSGSNRHDDAAAVERAEALCGRIENLLSAASVDVHDSGSDRSHRPSTSATSAALERQRSYGRDDDVGVDQRQTATDGTDVPASDGRRQNSPQIGGIVCPNGRRDLPQRLAAARDALVAVIGERTSVGSLRVALLELRSAVAQNSPAGTGTSDPRWKKDLSDRVSGLDKSVSDMKDSLRGGNGGHQRRCMDVDDVDVDVHNGGGGGGGGGGPDGGAGGVTEDDLEERLGFKADVSWVQRELQRLWDALDSRAMAAAGAQQAGDRPRSAPSSNNSGSRGNSNKENDNPEMAGEEESDVTPGGRVISTSLPSSTVLAAGAGGGTHGQRSSFNEGSSIIKDLLRKTSRLEQQMGSKADSDEVARALSSIGNKLRKVGVIIPAVQEELSNKIEKKDLTKLVALVTNGGSLTDGPPGSGNANNANNKNNSNNSSSSNDKSAVLASRLNSKFRCLSCDRPLPALGPPGPPKLGSSGLSVAGAGAPRSPQRTKSQSGHQQRLRLAAGVVGDEALSGPSSPAVKSPTSEGFGDYSDVAGWGGGGGSSAVTLGGTADNESGGAAYYSKDKDGGGRRRQHHQRGGDPPAGRLEPIGPNGEQIAGVLSRYPRMMPPPSRVRTAAGGGIGSRPGSSSGGRI